jgi:hypothetical protein
MTASASAMLDRLLEPVGRSMPPDFARELLEIRATPELQDRIDHLASRANQGQLTEADRDEYDGYIHAIHLISILQSKSRRSLAARAQ